MQTFHLKNIQILIPLPGLDSTNEAHQEILSDLCYNMHQATYPCTFVKWCYLGRDEASGYGIVMLMHCNEQDTLETLATRFSKMDEAIKKLLAQYIPSSVE